jgi:hypothetical protein
MSFDRTIYDKGAYMAKTGESNTVLGHVLDINRHESCNVCAGKPNVSRHEDRVALENDLLRIGNNARLSRDPKDHYQKNEKIADQLNYIPPYLCERNLSSPGFLLQNDRNNYMNQMKQ